MITIQDLLKTKTDLFDKSKVKLVRHKDSRTEYRDIIKNRNRNEIIAYQASQSKNVFKNIDYVVSFIGIENNKSLFFGVFKLNGIKEKLVENGKERFIYDMEEIKGFEDLINRVVIDWGKGAINWHQNYKNIKEVVEVLPKGYIGNFPGLTNFVLNFNELKQLINNPDANKDWKNHLSSVNGIYLILDNKTGNQYIGSAYGKNGIWQRWSEYAKNYHGNNVELKKMIEKDKNYYKHFKYSVLQTLPSNILNNEIIRIENIYKEKLGTRAHGLNKN